MKYGVLKYRESSNLGDEIQSIAAMQFLPRVDYFIDRDYINEFEISEPIKIIFNGWFMAKPENWPPPKNIIPLFISFHINNSVKECLLKPQSLEYFKQHEPIGCRDYETEKLLKSKGIKAYYSACLTLTLKNKFQKRNNDILCVDAFYPLGEILRKKSISHLFPKIILENVKFINQDVNESCTKDEKFAKAQELVDLYAQSKLVITSRIHCALPCLALKTPVYFMDVGFEDKTRITDLIQMMNVINDKNFPFVGFSMGKRFLNFIKLYKILSPFYKINIDWENPDANPVDITEIAENLKETCTKFINQNE